MKFETLSLVDKTILLAGLTSILDSVDGNVEAVMPEEFTAHLENVLDILGESEPEDGKVAAHASNMIRQIVADMTYTISMIELGMKKQWLIVNSEGKYHQVGDVYTDKIEEATPYNNRFSVNVTHHWIEKPTQDKTPGGEFFDPDSKFAPITSDEIAICCAQCQQEFEFDNYTTDAEDNNFCDDLCHNEYHGIYEHFCSECIEGYNGIERTCSCKGESV